MSISLIAKIVPKNNAFIGLVDADQVIGLATSNWNSAYTITSALNSISGIVRGDGAGHFSGITIGAANKVLAINSAGNDYVYRSVIGTSNQVTVNNGADSITISLPQNIATTSTPTFAQITVAADPVAALEVATKAYVDANAQGLIVHDSCRVATTASITLSGTQTIDDVAVVAGNRVLVKNQSSSQNNGIYIANTSTWTRATDMDTWAEVIKAYVLITAGTANMATGWTTPVAAGGTIGVTAMPWAQFITASTPVAGTGITVAGYQVSLATGRTLSLFNSSTDGLLVGSGATTIARTLTQGTGITVTNGTGVSGNPTVALADITQASGGSLLKISIDSQGRITGNSAVGASDIPDLSSIYQPLSARLTSVAGLAGTTGLVAKSGADTFTLDTNAYLTGNQTITLSGAITGSGTTSIATTLATVAANLGGTGFTSYAVGNLLYADSTSTLAKLAFSAGNVLLAATAGTIPSWGKVPLTTHVTGILPIANGGTNANLTATAGGIIYRTSTDLAVTAAGTSGYLLKSNAATAPTWVDPTTLTVSLANNVAAADVTDNATYYPAILSATGGTVPVKTASTKLTFNPSTGNFGLGLVATEKLELTGGRVKVTQAVNNPTTGFITYGVGTASTTYIGLGVYDNGKASLQSAGMLLLNQLGGFVGVNNATPLEQLDVIGNIKASGNYLGTWTGAVVTGQYGGTGVANTGRTLTMTGGSLTFTVSGDASVTLPLAGTLAILGANTFTAKQTLLTPTLSSASLLLPNGVTPTTPVAGDLWAASDILYWQNSTTTKTIAFTDGSVANVTGVVAIANGGTGQTTKVLGFNALSPLTAIGDTMYHDGTNSVRLSGNATATKMFLSQTSSIPSWSVASKSDVGLGSVENTALSTWAGTANITTLGTIATGVWNATAIAVNKGGTNITSYAVGDLLYASGSTTLSRLADVATGNALISGGVTTAPSWGKIGLTTHISGVLPAANGGTGVANASTITLGGNLTISGAYTLTLTIGNNTSITLPSAGTLAILGANTFTGKQSFIASVLANASLLIPNGTAPTSPVAGDIWAASDLLYYRNSAAATKTIAFTDSSITGTATNATNVGITDTTTDATHYLTFVSATSGNTPMKIVSNRLTVNPSTGETALTGRLTVYQTSNTPLPNKGLIAYGATGATTTYIGIGVIEDNKGGIQVGGNAAYCPLFLNPLGGNVGIGSSFDPLELLEVDRSNGSPRSLIACWSTTLTHGPQIVGLHSKSATIGSLAQTDPGTYLMSVIAQGVTTAGARVDAASIRFVQDAVSGDTYMPGRIEFLTGTNAATVSRKMILMSDGKFGIGSQAPSCALDVYAIAGFAENLTPTYNEAIIRGYDNRPTISYKGTLDLEMSGNAAVQDCGCSLTFSSNKWISGRSYTAVAAALRSGKETGSLVNQRSDSYLSFYTADSSTLNEVARFTSAGNLAIGGTTSSARLTVYKNTAAPFEIRSTTATDFQAIDFNVTNGAAAQIYSTSSGGTETTKALILGCYGYKDTQLVLDITGRVGIGKTSPATTLDVNGVITATGGTSTDWNSHKSTEDAINGLVNVNGAGTYSAVEYATGTWNPGLVAGTSGTITLSGTISNGRYTKIGKMIIAQCLAYVSSVSSPVGTLSVTNLPYAGGSALLTTALVHSTGLTTEYTIMYCRSNSTTSFIFEGRTNGTVDNAVASRCKVDTALRFTIVYYID